MAVTCWTPSGTSPIADPLVNRVRQGLERTLEWIVVVLMASLAVLVVVAVAFRRSGGALVWYDEVASVMLAWLTYYGSALAALNHQHIGFPRFVERARPGIRRALIAVRSAVVIGFFGVVTWAGIRVLGILGGLTMTSLPWIPSRLTQSVIPVGAALFIIAELLSAAERIGGRAT